MKFIINSFFVVFYFAFTGHVVQGWHCHGNHCHGSFGICYACTTHNQVGSTYCDGIGAHGCRTCPAGQEPNSGHTACQDCPKGKYADSNIRDRNGYDGGCKNCPAGRYNTNTGSNSIAFCSDYWCDRGYYCLAGSINAHGDTGSGDTPCPAGRYRSTTGGASVSDCTACDVGYYCLEGSSGDTPCPAGTYRSTPGGASESDCNQCPAGRYNTNTGSTISDDCTNNQCDAGYY